MSKYAESFSVNFALKMVHLVDPNDVLWLNHIITPYPDDDPVNLRHLRVMVEKSNKTGMEMECFVRKERRKYTEYFWNAGSAIMGYIPCGHQEPIHYWPEHFFQYSNSECETSGGMEKIRRVPVSIVETAGGFVARVLDDPDEPQGVKLKTSRDDGNYPSATGLTRREALGALVEENLEQFQIVLR